MHFYEKTADGVQPRHFVDMSSRPGELRPTRITDARKAGWYPSVTTVMGMLDKPALTDWKITEHLKQAYRLASGACSFTDRDWADPIDEWIEEVKRETQAALDKAPKDGTDFHDSLERFMRGEQVGPFDEATCIKAKRCLIENVGSLVWNTEQSFVHKMGFAGKVDLSAKVTLKDPDFNSWVIDWKTKNTKDKWKPGKMVYQEHIMQLAAYRVGLGLPNARCANVFICLETGEVEFCEHSQDELDTEWASFADLLRIWIRRAKYIPGSI